MEKKVIIYTDGSCLGNPGPGGYGIILRYNNVSKEVWGGEPETTNNQMELTGAIKALEELSRSCSVEIHIDSQYVMNGFAKGWLNDWKKRGWKTSANKPVKNQELWQKLDELVAKHNVEWFHVRGHQGHKENERCDELARNAALEVQTRGTFQNSSEYSVDKKA